MPLKNDEENLLDIQCDKLYSQHACLITYKKNLITNGHVFKLFGCTILLLTALQFYSNTCGNTVKVDSAVIVKSDPVLLSTTPYPRGYKLNDTTTYDSFMEMLYDLEVKVPEGMPKYTEDTPICQFHLDSQGPITANKTKVKLEWVEQQLAQVNMGGFYAPTFCRSRHKVAILVSFRNRETNLAIFLNHMHPFLMKQLLNYRIFVIEQYGTKKFNKGSLYNIGFLESQRYDDYHCIFFHDVDLLPIDERILYSCPRMPTHLSASVESHGYRLPYLSLIGGVSAMTPEQYEAVNGYSNAYWDWGAEDDDMFVRLQARRFQVVRYSAEIGKFATLPHTSNSVNYNRMYTLSLAKKRFREEGLRSIEYKLINITERKLFTHILADVNPYRTPV